MEDSSRRYSAVLEHQSTQSYFLRTNSAYQFIDLNDLKVKIQDQMPHPSNFTVFNVRKKIYTKDALVRDRATPTVQKTSRTETLSLPQRTATTATSRKFGSMTTRSVSTFRAPASLKAPLFPLVTTRSSSRRKAKVVRFSAQLDTIDSQCKELRNTLLTERLDTMKQRKEAAASILDVRSALETKIAQSLQMALPAPLIALRSKKGLHFAPEVDARENLEVSRQLREYKRHLWTNAMKKSLTKEMRYVYTLGTCTVLPNTLES